MNVKAKKDFQSPMLGAVKKGDMFVFPSLDMVNPLIDAGLLEVVKSEKEAPKKSKKK